MPPSPPPCWTCDGNRWITTDVPVDHPDFGRAIACPTCLAPQLETLNLARHFGDSGITGPLLEMTFAAFTMRTAEKALTAGQRRSLQLALTEAVNFSASPDGFLLFTGEPGCGKTHLAVAVAQALLQRGIATLFVVVPDLLDHLRAAFDKANEVSFDDRWNAVKDVRVLVLDDFGAQSDTPWAREKLYQLVNHRLNSGLPLVITSNWTLADFDAYHPRIASRLKLAAHARITAPDARGVKL